MKKYRYAITNHREKIINSFRLIIDKKPICVQDYIRFYDINRIVVNKYLDLCYSLDDNTQI